MRVVSLPDVNLMWLTHLPFGVYIAARTESESLALTKSSQRRPGQLPAPWESPSLSHGPLIKLQHSILSPTLSTGGALGTLSLASPSQTAHQLTATAK